jgi:hypothetical protein
MFPLITQPMIFSTGLCLCILQSLAHQPTSPSQAMTSSRSSFADSLTNSPERRHTVAMSSGVAYFTSIRLDYEVVTKDILLYLGGRCSEATDGPRLAPTAYSTLGRHCGIPDRYYKTTLGITKCKLTSGEKGVGEKPRGNTTFDAV